MKLGVFIRQSLPFPYRFSGKTWCIKSLFMKEMFAKFCLTALLCCWALIGRAQIQVAVFSINDFHGAFVRNDHKGIAGAPSVLQTLDSLKHVYPFHVTVSAGDNFGGSYFYNATHGALLPVFFNDLGIRVSAVGNHEFDDGQRALAAKWEDDPLRPVGWDLTYVCANVRSVVEGSIPHFAQPVVSIPVALPGGKTLRVAFVGLLTSSTPQQASVRKLAGLTFDGNYPAVLDSVMRLPEASLVQGAQLRLLLTHIGSRMDANGQPEWDDPDSVRLASINSSLWQGILSSHSHERVAGYINEARYPIVQGKWHGDYISMLLCTVDTASMRVTDVVPHTIPVMPKRVLEPKPARLQAQIDSLLQHTKTAGGTPLGEVLTAAHATLVHDRDDKYRQSEVGTLVCKAYAEAYRHMAGLDDASVVIGCSHFGSIRAGFVEGPVSVLDVGEALPFSNALKVYALTGRQITDLVEFGLHNLHYGWLQTGNLDIERDEQGHVARLFYVSPQGKRVKLQTKQKYILVADEFITTGGDGYSPSFFPEGQEVKVKDLPATTDAFIDYLRSQKEI